MKKFDQLNYYELLEIHPTAHREEIQRGYEMANKTYGADSIATYSLFDHDSRKRIIDRIEEAFSVLSDDKQRQQYNLRLGLPQPKLHSAKPVNRPRHSPKTHQQNTVAGEEQTSLLQEDHTIDISEQEINGKLFQQLRERQGIPLQEMADKTCINITYLQYIEQDRFDNFPAEVYLKGYLVQYVRMLGLDPVSVTNRYLSLYQNWRQSKKKVV